MRSRTRFVSVIAAVGAGVLVAVVSLWGDQRYHAILLTPAYGDGWGKDTFSATSRVIDPCQRAYSDPLQCIIFPRRVVPGRAEYNDNGVRVVVTAANLTDPDDGRTGMWTGMSDASARASLEGKVLLQIIVWTSSAATKVDLTRIRILEPCGPGTDKSPAGDVQHTYVPYTGFRTRPGGGIPFRPRPDYLYGALLLRAHSPSTIRQCALDFQDAIKSGAGKAIPPVHLYAAPVAYYRGIY